MEGQNLGLKAPIYEQRTGEKAATEPRHIESSEDSEDGGVRLNDEHRHLLTVKEAKKPVGTASGPAFGKENGQPKPILETTVGTPSKLRQTERGGSPSGQVASDEESENNSGGVRLFNEAVGRLRVSQGRKAANNASSPVRESQGRGPIPKVMLDTDAGLILAKTNSKGEPVFVTPPAHTARETPGASNDDSSVDKAKVCPNCVLF